jgi:hypothetical protein
MDLWKGRLAQKPFALGVTAVYLTGIAAHALLSGEVMARAGIWPFIVVQAVLIAIWLVLHIRRLRDAGQGPAVAVGVALVYILSLALLLMLLAFFTNPNAVAPSNAESAPADGLAEMPIVFLLAVLFKPDAGVFMGILKGLIVIALLPTVIALIFSIHTATRPPA